MKILIAGDVHGSTSHMVYLLEQARRKDAEKLFQVGDFGYWEHARPGVEYLNRVQAHALSHGVDVYFLDGNHDNRALLLEKYQERDDEGFIIVRPNIKYADRGHTWDWDGTRFIALGGAYSIDKSYRLKLEYAEQKLGAYWFPGEEMTALEWSYVLKDRSNVDVVLAHDKPFLANPRWDRKNLPPAVPNQQRLQNAISFLEPKLYINGGGR